MNLTDKCTKLIRHLLKNLDILTDYIVIIKYGDHIKTYNSISKDITNFLKTQSMSNIKKTLDIFDKYYYNTANPIVDDSDYDLISDHYYGDAGNKSDKIGSEILSNKVELPVYMGSMDKVKLGQVKLTNFLKKYSNNKFISSKLDGISMLIGIKNNIPKAYTRGNGLFGKDLSRFLKYIKTSNNNSLFEILKKLPDKTYIRGELIISKSDWKKFSYLGSNARNMAMGITNRKKITSEIKICKFIGYEYISSSHLSISEQFKKIQELKLDIPYHILYKNPEISEESLPLILKEFKNKSKFDIDGIIIQDDIYYPKNKTKNPKYAKAFKMEKYNESGISTILEIRWNTTKNMTLKPVITIEPIKLSNITIKKVYGYNAKYIKKNKLGKGAIIKVIRSGDVIPKVKEVIEGKFDVDIDFPKIYKWDSNNLNIMITESNIDVVLSQLEYFVRIAGIEFCKKSTLAKLYKVGIKSVKDFIKINNKDIILKADGIKDKSAGKIFASIKNKLRNITLINYISAIPVYNGISVRRIELLVKNIPKFYVLNKTILLEKIITIKGFSHKNAELIISKIDNCKEYIDFYKTCYGSFKKKKRIVIKNGKFKNRVFCFSGIRDKILEEHIIRQGGKISNIVSNTVTDLVVKDKKKSSNKLKKAKQNNLNIVLYDNLNKL